MFYNMQLVQQLNALELYCNNCCQYLLSNWFAWVNSVTGVAAIYSRDIILVRILKISEGLLHCGCDVVHGGRELKASA
jgi:hypothetical protein